MTILSRSALASCSYEDIFILYYQDTDGIVRESRHHPDGSWHIIEILGSKQNVMLNTPLSITCLRNRNSWEIHLYYLNTTFEISSIYWDSAFNKWYNIKILDISNNSIFAAPFSKLACTFCTESSKSPKNRHFVCFQNSDLLLKKIKKTSATANGQWVFEDNIMSNCKLLPGSSLIMGSNMKSIQSYSMWIFSQDENCIFQEFYSLDGISMFKGVYNPNSFKFLPGSAVSGLFFKDIKKRVYNITANNEIIESHCGQNGWNTKKTGIRVSQGTAVSTLIWDNPDVNLQLRLIHQLPNDQVQQLVFANDTWGDDKTAKIMATP